VGAGLALALWVATMATPVAMAVSREREVQERGLDALAYIARENEGLHSAALWARSELSPEEHVVAQMIGEAYSTGNFLASISGVPTILAWPGHQRQWRGDIAEMQRRTAVDAIYSGTPEMMHAAVEQWGVTHVYVGRAERAQFGPDVRMRFGSWEVVYEAGSSALFAVPSDWRGTGEGGR